MKYKKILKSLSKKEGVTVKQLEAEMKSALAAAGLSCSVKEFIESGTTLAKERLYIVR